LSPRGAFVANASPPRSHLGDILSPFVSPSSALVARRRFGAALSPLRHRCVTITVIHAKSWRCPSIPTSTPLESSVFPTSSRLAGCRQSPIPY